MYTGQRVNIRISHKNYPILRPAELRRVFKRIAYVRFSDGKESIASLDDVWICAECGGPGEMRFKNKCWCEKCFCRDELPDVPDCLENHIRTKSPIADMQRYAPDLRGCSEIINGKEHP